MESKLSRRLVDIIDALPLRSGIKILEIGCGPGAMARVIADRIDNGFVLGIDRSANAIDQAIKGSKAQMETGKLSFRKSAIEEFELKPDEELFDIAVAVRVGALDGRHPGIEEEALLRIATALKPGGKLYIDGGSPLKEVPLKRVRKHSPK